jgi:hypothetical protein
MNLMILFLLSKTMLNLEKISLKAHYECRRVPPVPPRQFFLPIHQAYAIILPAMKKPPEFLKKYFWDIDFAALDLARDRNYVLKRILEYGDARAVRWMNKNFKRTDIVSVLFNARIDPRSANYWAHIYRIRKGDLLCLRKPYLQERRKTWPY